MNKTNRIRIGKWEWTVIILYLILYIVLDYYNIPSALGFSMKSINYNALSILVGAFVALIIFILTYEYVDQRNIEKINNQKEIAALILKRVYDDCNEYIVLLDDVLETLVERTDFNAYYEHNSPAAKYADIPFENEKIIMQFATDGVISKEQLEKYYKIKHYYLSYVTTNVIFYDHPEKVVPTKMTLLRSIENARSAL